MHILVGVLTDGVSYKLMNFKVTYKGNCMPKNTLNISWGDVKIQPVYI